VPPVKRPPKSPAGSPEPREPYQCNNPSHKALNLIRVLISAGAFGAGYIMQLLPIPTATFVALAAIVLAVCAIGYYASFQYVLPWARNLLEARRTDPRPPRRFSLRPWWRRG
jgi:hypothetical protein